jgi:tyrosinase
MLASTAVKTATPAKLQYRVSADGMSASQLTAFRQAISASKALSDDRGFNYWAGIHGLPLPMYCQHHTNLFLPWHRAYLYFFELSLQDLVAGVTLPWWDWSSAISHRSGIPKPYTDTKVGTQANPLYSSPIPAAAQVTSMDGVAPPTQTSRQPGNVRQLPSPAQVQAVLQAPNFLDFSQRVEDLHDSVHVWAGGTMAEIPWAAYDPVFFAHHCMIDRLWRLWQLGHTGGLPPQSLLGEALPPFRMTVAQTLSVNSLGYEYASTASSAAVRG